MSARNLRRLWRAARVSLHLLWGLCLAVTLVLLRPLLGGRLYPRLRDGLARYWLGAASRAVGLRCEWRGRALAGPVLIVANHISWLDILVLGRVFGPGFVAKAEVARWPLLGWLARQAGTLFLQRGHRGSAGQVLDQLTWQLAGGRTALLFPEGTTSDGSGVLRFKPRLFQAAVRTRVPVQPVALRYRGPGGGPGPVPFLGEQSFFANLWQVLAMPALRAEVDCLPPLQHGLDPRILAESSQNSVARALDPARAAAFASQSAAL